MREAKRGKLFLHLKKWMEKAIMDYKMIAAGDRVLICVSGGADSMVLLDLLDSPMVFVPSFSRVVVNIDMGFDPSFQTYEGLRRYFSREKYEYILETSDIGPLSHSSYNKKNPCFLCSRLRRKRLFEIAAEQGCNKVSLAHHRDDIIETLLLNMLYGREISTMMPNQSIFAGKLSIIRPLTYLREKLVKRYAAEQMLPAWKNLCPSSNQSKRIYIKNLLDQLEKDNRLVRDNLFRAMGHVKTDYLPGKYIS